MNSASIEADAPGLGAQARTLAVPALARDLEAFELGIVPALEFIDDAVPGPSCLCLPRSSRTRGALAHGERHIAPPAPKQGRARLLGQRAPGRVEIDLQVLGKIREQLGVIAGVAFLLPGFDGLAERLLGVGNHEIRIEAALDAEPVAGRAGAGGAVERKETGRNFGERNAAIRAGARARQKPLGFLGVPTRGLREHDREPVGEFQRCSQGILDARPGALTHDDTIDHELDVVSALARELDIVLQFVHDAVDAGVHVAPSPHLLDFLAVGPPSTPNHGRENLGAAALVEGEYAFGHLPDALRRDGAVAARAMRPARPSKEKPQVVGDLGGGAHRASWAAADAALLDGERGGEPLDGFDVGLLELVEKLTRIGGKRLDVAALALGVEGVESQAGFPGARGAGEDHEFVSRDANVDAAKVVGARTAHDDFIVLGCAAEARDRVQQAGNRAHGRALASA